MQSLCNLTGWSRDNNELQGGGGGQRGPKKDYVIFKGPLSAWNLILLDMEKVKKFPLAEFLGFIISAKSA